MPGQNKQAAGRYVLTSRLIRHRMRLVEDIQTRICTVLQELIANHPDQ